MASNIKIGDVVRLNVPRIMVDGEWGYTVDEAPPMVVEEILKDFMVRCVYWRLGMFQHHTFHSSSLVEVRGSDGSSQAPQQQG